MKKQILFIVIFSGVFLRFFRLGSHSFWCDEFLAISLARINLSEMLGFIIKTDAHPPLFYTLIHYIYSFTQSEFGLRFVPALFGAGTIVVFFLMLKQMHPENYFLPLFLFVFSPAAILWSQMVKSYSMLTFFSLLSVLMFFNFGRSRKFVYAMGWVLSGLISLYLHNYGVIVLFAQVVTIFLRRKELHPKIFLLPLLVILLAYLPYLAGPVFSQVSFVQNVSRTAENVFLRFTNIFFYFVFGETLSPLNLKFVVPGVLFFLYFFTAGFFSHGDILKTFSVVLFCMASALTLLISITIPQNLIHLQPFFFILVASGIDNITRKRKRIIVSILPVLFLIPPVYYYYSGNSLQYHDASKLIPYRQVSELIRKEGKKGEVVVFTEARGGSFVEFFEPFSPWDWYYKGNLPLIEVNPASVQNLHRELEKIYEEHNGFWMLLNYGFVEHSWNDRVKDFFLDGKSVKIKEMKLVKNYSFLDFLKGKGKQEYYFLEVYHLIKAENE